MKRAFTRNLIKWHYVNNKRTMPWKGERDPYKIWLSEIILQQTRVEQGLSYYNSFIDRYPTIQTLAAAKDEEVYKLWEGLGYYSRCKNLLHTARIIVNDKQGIFPDTYEEMLTLKGVGPYTAAAISSFAYGLPQAVVDGNVFRVLSRYFGVEKPIDSSEGKKYFSTLAQMLLYKADTAAYNQSIMDFGATVCKPQIPLCQQCTLQSRCIAYKSGMVNKLPVKEKQLLRRQRWFYYFIFTIKNQILIHKRPGKDIWENLHEFFLYETATMQKWDDSNLNSWMQEQLGISGYFVSNISPVYKQPLTHQVINGQFFHVDLTSVPKSLSHLKVVNQEQIKSLSFPKFINQHLELINVNLD
ncbi:MAG TPA: A/G-specific adenine glycosylase [Segetibacter sp.]|jgi:A/G-specific adenine glycosylase